MNVGNTNYCFLIICIFSGTLGHRVVGLDACYTDHKGKVALQAERCADIIIPETPDPVLTSCGVVLLYQDPQSRLVNLRSLMMPWISKSLEVYF